MVTFFIFSLTHSLPTPYTLPSRALFGRRGGRQLRELSPTPFPTFFIYPYVSPIDRFFTHPTPLSPLSNSKLATTYMGYTDRALAHSNIRPSGSSLIAFQQGIETFRSNWLYVLKLFKRVSWCKLYFSINRDLFGTRLLHWRSLHIQRYKSIPLLKPNWFSSGKMFMIMFSRTVSQMCL